MKFIYISFIIFLSVAALALLSFSQKSHKDNLDLLPSDSLQQVVNKTAQSEDIPGIVAAIIDSSGITSIAAAGIRKLGVSDLMTKEDKLHLGSCTKAMTSTMLAILVAEKQLSWESTIAEIFSALKDSIHTDYHDITLHQLVRHRGGIAAQGNWWGYLDQEIRDRRKSIIVASLKNKPAQQAGDFLYSNLGYMIAGAMAEEVTGTTWEDLMQQKLFDPLDMSSAGFGAPGEKDKIDQPWGHSNLWLSGLSPSQGDNAAALGPAGTVHCTIGDWAKFVSFLFLQKDQSLLDKDLLEDLKEPDGEYAAGWNKLTRTWALGPAFTHSGSNTMWLSVAWVAPNIGKAYLVVTNAYDKNTHKICDEVISAMIKM